MPPLPLTNLLHAALPQLSTTSRAVVNALVAQNGHAPSAGDVAVWVGLRDRHQLARSLRRDGLPTFERLAGWTRVLYWLLEAQASDSSLLGLARREHLDPAVAYRLVRRVTGLRWSEARRAGVASLLSRFHGLCVDHELAPPGRGTRPIELHPAAAPPNGGRVRRRPGV